MQGTGGLQGPEYYSIVHDLGDDETDGFLHNIFVANVNFDDDGQLKVNANHFSNDNVWNAEDCPRIVVPQLTLAS